MKKLFSLLLMAGLSFGAFAQDAVPTLSPLTKMYLIDAKKLPSNINFPQGYLYKKRSDGTVCISAIIKINSSAADKVQDRLNIIRASVGTKAGNIWTVQVPAENVLSFTKINGIHYIQIDEPVIPQLEAARNASRVDSAHGGYSLPIGYSGKDVLVGIIDFGFDYNHPTMYDTTGTKYRIIKAWEMNGTGTPPVGFTYGNEITDTNALKAKGTDNPVQTHGTGVAGLAAGSGFGSPSPGLYRGVAYQSEMVFVGVRRDSIGGQWLTGGFSDFIDGVSYLMKYAKSVGKPIVVNISWGSHSGPHDGSSLVNQAFDTLSGQGKIIVMSAGNDGQSLIHLSKTFSATDTALSTFLSFSSTPMKRTWIDIWGDTAKTFCVNTKLYSKGIAGTSTGKICIDNGTHLDTLISANGLDTCFVQTITSSAEYNMKPRVTINVYNKATDSIGITVSGTSGKINMWNEYYYYGYTFRYRSEFVALGFPWAVSGNFVSTASDMGAGKSTLLVGSFNSKVNYVDINGIPQSYGSGLGLINRISSYSSRGPYIDGRIKPDLAAPGAGINTSVSSWDTGYTETGSKNASTVSKYTDLSSGKNYYYGQFTGTSASSPMAAGIVALLLQADPTLSPENIKEILFETAITDAGTGIVPPAGTNTWGHGKINAYGALRKLIKDLSVYHFEGKEKLDAVLFPNPNNGIFTLDFTGTKTEQIAVSVLDISGKAIQTQNWTVHAGQNNLPLNLSSVAKGIYFVKIEGQNSAATIKAQVQ